MHKKDTSEDPFTERLDEDCCEVFCYALAGVSAFPLTLWVFETLGEYYAYYSQDSLE